MIREFSAGAVVLRRMKNQWWVAVIEPGREGELEDRKHVIALPKGNIDPGEKALGTAIREVREETGLLAGPVTKLGDIKYVYQRKWSDGAKIFKIVSFFLMKHRSGHIGDIKPNMKHEVRRAYWLPLDQVASSLSYGGEKQIAKKAAEYLKAHPQGLEASPKLGSLKMTRPRQAEDQPRFRK
jgi:8-oxo-dGTP pyrophosphatase MutT (NUDIX family)